VVLGGDRNSAGFKILHGLIATAVTKFEFEGLSAEGVSQHLVAQTDSKNREFG
jgi:hypothetical protein